MQNWSECLGFTRWHVNEDAIARSRNLEGAQPSGVYKSYESYDNSTNLTSKQRVEGRRSRTSRRDAAAARQGNSEFTRFAI
jgi:hypothetical protein